MRLFGRGNIETEENRGMNHTRITDFQEKNSVKTLTKKVIDSFLSWIDKFGFYSYDQYDFWASRYGAWAKRVYYKNHMAGVALVSPCVLLDTFIPSSRKLFAPKRRFPIADAHLILGILNLYELRKQASLLDEARRIGLALEEVVNHRFFREVLGISV